MRPHLVVVPPPALDHRLRLGPRAEPLQAQALVAEFAVEVLRRSILPGLAGIDQCGGDALVHDPLQKRPRHELGPVVGAQIERGAALALANKLARIAWSVLHHGRDFEVREISQPVSQPA
jgi:hypothetical protein